MKISNPTFLLVFTGEPLIYPMRLVQLSYLSPLRQNKSSCCETIQLGKLVCFIVAFIFITGSPSSLYEPHKQPNPIRDPTTVEIGLVASSCWQTKTRGGTRPQFVKFVKRKINGESSVETEIIFEVEVMVSFHVYAPLSYLVLPSPI